MAFRVQGTSPSDQALVVAMRELARVEDTTFSGVVRQAFSDYLGEPGLVMFDDIESRAEVEAGPSSEELAAFSEMIEARKEPCDHRWERGASGMVRCSRCKETKT